MTIKHNNGGLYTIFNSIECLPKAKRPEFDVSYCVLLGTLFGTSIWITLSHNFGDPKNECGTIFMILVQQFLVSSCKLTLELSLKFGWAQKVFFERFGDTSRSGTHNDRCDREEAQFHQPSWDHQGSLIRSRQSDGVPDQCWSYNPWRASCWILGEKTPLWREMVRKLLGDQPACSHCHLWWCLPFVHCPKGFQVLGNFHFITIVAAPFNTL